LAKHTRASMECRKAKDDAWFDAWLKDSEARQARLAAQRDAVLRGLDAEHEAAVSESVTQHLLEYVAAGRYA
jgi:hypothetical protein